MGKQERNRNGRRVRPEGKRGKGVLEGRLRVALSRDGLLGGRGADHNLLSQ